MQLWQLFWTVSLVAAGASFAFITLVVMIRGARDLREMIRDLGRQREEDSG